MITLLLLNTRASALPQTPPPKIPIVIRLIFIRWDKWSQFMVFG